VRRAVYHFTAVAINSDGQGSDASSPSALPSSSPSLSIDELVAAGRHAEAAAQASAQGEPLRAAAIYERIWDFGRAALCARVGGDLPQALRNAIDARDEALVIEIATQLAVQGPGGQRAAMEAFAQRRRFGEAGERAEAAGDVEAAIAYYQQAHRELDAARLLGQAGRDREAGRLLERMIAVAAPGLELAQARLALGRLLLRRMQYAAAAAHLQEATQEPATRDLARRSLIVALAGMGLRDAARDVLIVARADQPALPADLESFLQAERAPEHSGERADARAEDGGGRERGPGHGVDAGPSRRDDEPPRIAGRYRLDDLLGAGGSGRVYRAHDEVTGRTVAIKIFSLARDHQAYERFVREARVTSGLDHANLVQVFDFSAEHGYLVMEHLAGGSLAARLGRDTGERGRALGVTAVRRLALDVLAGLERAHRRGVIHRDIKPANIFFDVRGTAKLGDFGVAHLLDLGQTQTGGLIGTLAYMAPEQITGAPLTIAADLYALGVTLYEALTGRLPFLGPDFVAQHLGETPPPVSSVAPEGVVLAAGWDEILARVLAKSPSERFESVDALRKALEALALERAPRPLVLPRRGSTRGDDGGDGPARREAGPGAGIDALAAGLVDAPAAPVTGPGAGAPDAGAGERYQFETPIGRTDVSHLSRAVDTVLDRSVIIERYLDGGLDQATERRLLGLARGGSSCVQWALACDRTAGVAVFEAPRGVPLPDALGDALGDARGDARLDARAAVRLLASLARAVAPMHERGVAHGAIGATTVLLDEQQNPMLLVCGLGRAPAEPSLPRDDVRDILRLVTGVARSAGLDTEAPNSSGPSEPGDPSGPSHPMQPAALAEALVDILVPGLAGPERAAILAPEPHDGTELYAFAERLEIAWLRAGQPMASERTREL
jgi:tRNA A-37 threonylcarbamoyl transferase component Bud32/tetratricopeptide (TPR) repeat protein